MVVSQVMAAALIYIPSILNKGIQSDTSVDNPSTKYILPYPHCVTASLTSSDDQYLIILARMLHHLPIGLLAQGGPND